MENIIISRPEEFEKVKKKISEDGTEKFHVLADFDKTLTKAFVDGKKIPSVISALRDGDYLTKDYRDKAHALFEKYHPIEIDPNISLEDKKKAMKEWWMTHFALLIESGLNKSDLRKVVEGGTVVFREGMKEFIDFLHDKNIPLIILSSSGLGDAVMMYLEKEGKLYDNVHIITNLYEWGSDGKAIGVKEPIIHSMNKDETAIQDYPVFNEIQDRTNVMLLGDNVEDIGMVEGFGYTNLIKVGFLNDKVKGNLERYKKNFDIVILNDSSVDYLNNLLKEIF